MKKEEAINSRLKRARLKLGRTLDQAYKDIKVHPRILEALEENKIDPGLGEVYIKGFLKKYARYLGVDYETVLADFNSNFSLKEPPAKELIQIGPEKRPSLIIKDRFKSSILPLTAALALTLTISIIGYAGLRLIKEIRRFQPPVSKALEKKDKETGGGIFLIPKNEPLRLEVKTKDKVWLRVKSDGKIIFEHTLPGGSTESWTAKEELELRVGRPEALTLTLNGKPLDLPDQKSIRKVVITHQGLITEK